MSRVVSVVPSDDARILHEVVAIAVAHVAIAVVIVVRTPYLILVNPDVFLQVGVIDKDTLVKHRHDHLLVARRALPRALALHIGIAHRLRLLALAELIATIDQVPLRRQQRVVHRARRACCVLGRSQTLRRQRCSLGAVGALDRTVEIDRLHLTQRLHTLCNLLGRATSTETNHIPLMQTLLAGTCLGTLVKREDALQLIAVDCLQNLVQRHRATACSRAARSLN